MKENRIVEKLDLEKLCRMVQNGKNAENLAQIEEIIKKKMGQYPNSSIPHNLLGIILEKQNNHVLAMKHFRAAYALDPTNKAVRYNIDQYTRYDRTGKIAYAENDCLEWEENWKEQA